MIIDVKGHTWGRGQQINSPFWVQGSPKIPAKLGPELGADTCEILKALGYDEANIEQLARGGVVQLAS